MSDPSETPAVPPEDPGGDVRFGLFLAGALLLFFGWGIAGLLNLYLHLTAPPGGQTFLWWVVFPTPGPYALAIAGGGAILGLLGIVLCGLARSEPKGPLRLPGVAY